MENQKGKPKNRDLKKMISKRISDYFEFIKLLPNTKLDDVIQRISILDLDNLINV